jgi:hypothetical protein
MAENQSVQDKRPGACHDKGGVEPRAGRKKTQARASRRNPSLVGRERTVNARSPTRVPSGAPDLPQASKRPEAFRKASIQLLGSSFGSRRYLFFAWLLRSSAYSPVGERHDLPLPLSLSGRPGIFNLPAGTFPPKGSLSPGRENQIRRRPAFPGSKVLSGCYPL